MAKARIYGWNGEYPAKELGGQQKIVFDVLRGAKDEMWTAKEWTDIVGDELRTTQDPYRVVLYYILILKNKGCIRTVERDIETVTKTPEQVKHGVRIYQTPHADDRGIIHEEPVTVDPFSAAVDAILTAPVEETVSVE